MAGRNIWLWYTVDRFQSSEETSKAEEARLTKTERSTTLRLEIPLTVRSGFRTPLVEFHLSIASVLDGCHIVVAEDGASE